MSQPWEVFPALFLERLQKLIPAEKLERVLQSFCAPKHTTFRANTLKVSPKEVLEKLTASGIALENVPWWPSAFIIKDVNVRRIFDELYTSGSIYIQSLSSMIPPLILDPQQGEKVLDLTAAPGSKTTQMAALMNNTGEIIANDLSPIRIFKLQANLKMQGVTNTFTRRGPGQDFWRKFPEYFDKTLVDVPCSMEGRISCAEPETYEDWSLKEIKTLAVRQAHLLRSAVSATKVGGTIVYSTCTLAPEENEEVVNWILEKEKGAVELEEVSLAGVEMLDGVTEWEEKKYDASLTKTKRILPSEFMEGFFVAKLRKTHSTLSAQPFSRPHRKKFQKFPQKRRK